MSSFMKSRAARSCMQLAISQSELPELLAARDFTKLDMLKVAFENLPNNLGVGGEGVNFHLFIIQ